MKRFAVCTLVLLPLAPAAAQGVSGTAFDGVASASRTVEE